MKRFSSLVLTLFIALAIVNSSTAQDQQGSESSLLPEIDPQDIEIRSQFKARFPGLRRQPILGFDPTPRVYQIDPNRTPFMETQEQVVANLPVSELSRPDPPLYASLNYSSEINAFGRFGIGSYVSPEAVFWGVSRINDNSYVGGDFDYSSSNGHLDDQQSSFRFFDANGEYVTKLSDKSRVGISGGFNSSFNNMFDLGPLSGIPDAAHKNYNGFHLGADFQHFKNTITGWQADAGIRYYNAELMNADDLSGKSEERVFNGSLAKRWAGSNISETFAIKAGVRGGNYDNNSQNVDKWVTAQGGVVYERLFNYQTKVSIDASVYYAKDEFTNKLYAGPEITVQHPLLDILSLTVKASAKPFVKTVEQLHTENRFLKVDNVLRHSYKMSGSAEARLKYANQGALNFGIQYEDISNYPIFQREAQIGFGPSYLFYETNYQDIYRAKAYVSVTHQLISDHFWLNGKFYMQSPNIKNGGRIPFEEKIGVNSSVIVKPFEKLTFEAWADYVGSRKTFQTNTKLDGFLLLGGQADFQITKRVGAYVKLVNLLNQDYQVWQGYTERPFQAYGGVTVKF